jgi:hypothetical protein
MTDTACLLLVCVVGNDQPDGVLPVEAASGRRRDKEPSSAKISIAFHRVPMPTTRVLSEASVYDTDFCTADASAESVPLTGLSDCPVALGRIGLPRFGVEISSHA